MNFVVRERILILDHYKSVQDHFRAERQSQAVSCPGASEVARGPLRVSLPTETCVPARLTRVFALWNGLETRAQMEKA